MQTSLYYTAVKTALSQPPLNPGIDPSWATHADFQSNTLKAASEYWQSQASKESASQLGTGYGQEITRLHRAEAILTAAISEGKKNKLNSNQLTPADSLLRIITTAKATAIHENNVIYMESVPADKDLPAIIPAVMVKPLPPVELTQSETPFCPYFASLLPKLVRQIRGEFGNEMDALMTKASLDCGGASTEARTFLSNLGLPGSLESYKSGGQLPEQLYAKIVKMQTLGGLDSLRSRFADKDPMVARIKQSLETINQVLEREEATDLRFHERYTTYRATRSITLTQDIKAQLKSLQGSLQEALTTDEAVMKDLYDPIFQQSLLTLSNTKEHLASLLPKPSLQADLLDLDHHGSNGSTAGNGGNGTHGIDTTALERLLLTMAGLIEERDKTLGQLEHIINTDVTEEIMSIYLQKDHSNPTATIILTLSDILPKYTTLIQPLLSNIQSSILQQADLLPKIKSENDVFINAQKNDPLVLTRNNLISQWEQAINHFFVLQGNLLAGFNFYSNYQVSGIL